MQLTENISLGEMTASATADECGIDNTPPPAAVASMRRLAESILQPVRAHFGAPLRISSGFRTVELNVAVGGGADSQHLRGQAADINIDGVPAGAVAAHIAAGDLPFDQVIFERRPDGREWVHVSCAGAGERARGQALTATFPPGGGKPDYAAGIAFAQDLPATNA